MPGHTLMRVFFSIKLWSPVKESPGVWHLANSITAAHGKGWLMVALLTLGCRSLCVSRWVDAE